MRGMAVFGAAFESWWKSKVGMDDTDIPVLPEFMVLKIDARIRVTPTAASSSQPALISTDLPARPPAAGWPPPFFASSHFFGRGQQIIGLRHDKWI